MELSAQARTSSHGGVSHDEVQVVEFVLGDDTFAVNLFDVREIVEAFKITPVPHAPPHVRGIIDLRGEITTVIDLKSVLQINKQKTDGQVDSRFIVLDEGVSTVKTGILVDDVTSVLTVPLSDIDQQSYAGDTSYILGVIRKSSTDREDGRKELIIWIDIRSLLQGSGDLSSEKSEKKSGLGGSDQPGCTV